MAAIGFNDYWRRRRRGMSNLAVMEAGGLTEHTRARQLWLEWIESPEMLELDVLFPRVPEWWDSWGGIVELRIVTVRSNIESARHQLDRLGLDNDALVVPHGDSDAQQKAQAVKGAGRLPVAWVGDTEVDIAAGTSLGVDAIGVTSGMRTRSFLLRAGAKRVYAKTTEIASWDA